MILKARRKNIPSSRALPRKTKEKTKSPSHSASRRFSRRLQSSPRNLASKDEHHLSLQSTKSNPKQEAHGLEEPTKSNPSQQVKEDRPSSEESSSPKKRFLEKKELNLVISVVDDAKDLRGKFDSSVSPTKVRRFSLGSHTAMTCNNKNPTVPAEISLASSDPLVDFLLKLDMDSASGAGSADDCPRSADHWEPAAQPAWPDIDDHDTTCQFWNESCHEMLLPKNIFHDITLCVCPDCCAEESKKW